MYLFSFLFTPQGLKLMAPHCALSLLRFCSNSNHVKKKHALIYLMCELFCIRMFCPLVIHLRMCFAWYYFITENLEKNDPLPHCDNSIDCEALCIDIYLDTETNSLLENPTLRGQILWFLHLCKS